MDTLSKSIRHMLAGIFAGLLTSFCQTGIAADAQEWLQWRGPNNNGISMESGWNPAALVDKSKVLWRVNVGLGFSSVSIQGKRLYTMGWQDNQATIRCLHVETGKEEWKYSYACNKVYYPGTRTTPAVDSGLLYAMGTNGLVLCLDASDGTMKWQRDLTAEKLAKAPRYGFGGSPRVEGDLLVLNAGESGIALDKKTGKTVWSSPAEQCGYATPVAFEMAGQKCAAIFGLKALRVVVLKTGETLCSYPWDTDFDCNCADPIVLGSKIFFSACYEKGSDLRDKGCVLLDISDWKPKPVWQNLNIRSHFSSCIALAGYIYGFDGRALDKKSSLKCIDLATGEEKWSQAVGFGSLMAADGKLILLNEWGTLFIVEATPAGYKELVKAEGILPPRCWTTPVLCGNRLFCRNDKGDLVCIDMSP